MNCPHCHLEMSLVEYEGVLIHTCDECGGEFVGPAELAHITRTREQKFPAVLQQALSDRQPVAGVPVEETEREVACPACSAPMQVINYCCDTGVCIDRCGQCRGIWLDNGELEKLQVLLERWGDEAPEKIRAIAGDLERVRRETAQKTGAAFAGSRFAFINALMNWFLDAA
ncbi:MAG: zf-TFIIB domain-containing protein [Phycisphaerales bacterium]|nr:MAG: zf-TFIIB domain-containing protein [Phycisphaerales bacterium]